MAKVAVGGIGNLLIFKVIVIIVIEIAITRISTFIDPLGRK